MGTAEALRRAAELLRHRGPDDQGLATWPAEPVPGCPFAALACHRPAIVDLSSAAHQPIATADGRYTLVLNGEIYNHPELRGELEALGHRFRSRSDSEVLLVGFARWGRGVLSRAVGMFAFAVYDAEQRRIFLARDPFGIKPLYYARAGGGVVFASEMDVLLELPGVSRRVNPQRLYDFLDRGDTDEAAETLFADVCQLEPAHCLELPLDDPGVGRAGPLLGGRPCRPGGPLVRGSRRPAAGPWRFEGDWVMRQMLHDTLMRNPIQALLRCGDRNAMAFSLENRVPFLTTALVEFAYALPEEYIVDRHGRRKAVFRQAMRGLVPDAILDRRDKIGFATPVGRWLLAVRPWAEERLRTVEQLPGLEREGGRAGAQ